MPLLHQFDRAAVVRSSWPSAASASLLLRARGGRSKRMPENLAAFGGVRWVPRNSANGPGAESYVAMA